MVTMQSLTCPCCTGAEEELQSCWMSYISCVCCNNAASYEQALRFKSEFLLLWVCVSCMETVHFCKVLRNAACLLIGPVGLFLKFDIKMGNVSYFWSDTSIKSVPEVRVKLRGFIYKLISMIKNILIMAIVNPTQCNALLF